MLFGVPGGNTKHALKDKHRQPKMVKRELIKLLQQSPSIDQYKKHLLGLGATVPLPIAPKFDSSVSDDFQQSAAGNAAKSATNIPKRKLHFRLAVVRIVENGAFRVTI